MKTSKLKSLKEERKRILGSASEYLLKHQVDEVNQKLDWIDAYQRLKSFNKSRTEALIWPIIVGIISLVIIGLSAIIRIPSATIQMDVTASEIGFVLTNDWELKEELKPEELTINNLKYLNAPGTGIIKRNQPFAVELINNISFRKLGLEENSKLRIYNDKEDIYFFIWRDSINDFLQVNSTFLNIIRSTTEIDSFYVDGLYPESIFFTTFIGKGEPIKIKFKGLDDWQISNFRVDSIIFNTEDGLGPKDLKSSIISGNVKILETGIVYSLEERDSIVLRGLRQSRFKISSSERAIKIHFEGVVDTIKLGPENFIKSAKPTILEYLYYQKFWAFIWSSVVVISGMLFSLKKTIFI